MKEDTEVAWEEVPEAGLENFREGEEELGEEPGEMQFSATDLQTLAVEQEIRIAYCERMLLLLIGGEAGRTG